MITNDYYDIKIKDARLIYFQYSNYKHYKLDISDKKSLEDIFINHKPNKVINLAAQAVFVILWLTHMHT